MYYGTCRSGELSTHGSCQFNEFSGVFNLCLLIFYKIQVHSYMSGLHCLSNYKFYVVCGV